VCASVWPIARGTYHKFWDLVGNQIGIKVKVLPSGDIFSGSLVRPNRAFGLLTKHWPIVGAVRAYVSGSRNIT